MSLNGGLAHIIPGKFKRKSLMDLLFSLFLTCFSLMLALDAGIDLLGLLLLGDFKMFTNNQSVK